MDNLLRKKSSIHFIIWQNSKGISFCKILKGISFGISPYSYPVTVSGVALMNAAFEESKF